MKPDLEKLVEVVAPLRARVADFESCQRVVPFNSEVVEFAADFSRALLSDSHTKHMPEIVALAFWMRRSQVSKLKDDFFARAQGVMLPRGLAFHIAPSNVDTIFIYSLLLSIFSGNANIVRLSSNTNQQVLELLRVFNQCLSSHSGIAERILVVRYDHNDDITQYFSSLCDLRIIWGGDETIGRIRRFALPPHAKELVFSDKFSLALIEPGYYIESNNKDDLAERFYNDSYWFDQMACSSPRLVVWVGEDDGLIERAQNDFWARVESVLAKKNHTFLPASLMDKYLGECQMTIEAECASVIETDRKLLSRVQVESMTDAVRELHCGQGLFVEMKVGSLEALSSSLKRKDQTVTVCGFDSQQLTSFVIDSAPAGVDRIVSFGEALDFSSVWDGYDLLLEMTRTVSISSRLLTK